MNSGAQGIVAALVTGGCLSLLVLAIALLISALTKYLRPESYRVTNKRIGYALIFLSAVAIVGSVVMMLIGGTIYLAGTMRGVGSNEFVETPFISLTLGLAMAPILTRHLSHLIRSWVLLALVLTLSFTIAVLTAYPHTI